MVSLPYPRSGLWLTPLSLSKVGLGDECEGQRTRGRHVIREAGLRRTGEDQVRQTEVGGVMNQGLLNVV